MHSLPFTHPPASVCILRLSALGDATHVLPVIRCLQDQWPETKLTWIVGKLECRLLAGLQGVEMLVFDKRGGWAEVGKLRQQLRNRTFDVLLHMQVSARANLLSRLIDAPIRLGWNRARSRDFHHWFINQPISDIPLQHQVYGFLEFARALGLTVGSPVWNLPVSKEAIDWAARWLEPARPNIIISPCSSHPLRNWRSANYATLADFAIENLDANVILSGGPSELEKRTGSEILGQMRNACTNLIGQDTLEKSKALLQGADLLISPDSGPTHIANALGTDVLGLYAATWSRRSGPFNSRQWCVDAFPEAARKFRGKPAEDLRWGTRIEVPGVMDLLTPQRVQEKLSDWLIQFQTNNPSA